MANRRWTTKPPLGWPIDQSHPLAQGLVSLWALGEGAGIPFDWALGTAASRALSNSATWAAGSPSGPALKFNGTSQYVGLGNPLQLLLTGPFTLACYAAPATGSFQVLLDARRGDFSAGVALTVGTSGNNELDLVVGNGSSSQSVYSSSSAVDGNWHLYAASMASTSTGGVAFYRDGNPIGTATLASFSPSTTPTAAIGARNDGSTHFLSGLAGWVAAWSLALPQPLHAAATANIWDVFMPYRTRVFGLGSAAILAYPPIVRPFNRQYWS